MRLWTWLFKYNSKGHSSGDWRYDYHSRNLIFMVSVLRTCVFCLKWNGPRDALTQKKTGFPCSGINAGSYLITQDEGMTECPVETLEKDKVLHLFWTEGLTSFWNIERCAEFIASKGDDVWLFVKIDRNTNIPVPTNKGRLASRLTFSSIRTVLPSLV